MWSHENSTMRQVTSYQSSHGHVATCHVNHLRRRRRCHHCSEQVLEFAQCQIQVAACVYTFCTSRSSKLRGTSRGKQTAAVVLSDLRCHSLWKYKCVKLSSMLRIFRGVFLLLLLLTSISGRLIKSFFLWIQFRSGFSRSPRVDWPNSQLFAGVLSRNHTRILTQQVNYAFTN